MRPYVQDAAQSEDSHEIRVRRPEKLQVSRLSGQLHAEHQSASSPDAAAQHLPAAEVLGT